MKKVLVIFMTFLILSFLAGIYFCMYSDLMHTSYKPYEGMENKVSTPPTQSTKKGEEEDAKKSCPNLLVHSGNSILLYNTNLPNNETNPMPFYNLDEYANYMKIQQNKGIHCPVLVLQQESNAQGDDVYRLRPDLFNPQSGSLQYIPSSQEHPKVVPVVDASRESRVYNKNNYAGFDPYGLHVGEYTVLDKIHDSTEATPMSDNPMDPNWGGVVYTQQKVDSGKYADNAVIKPNYTQPKSTVFYPQLYSSDGASREPPNYTIPRNTEGGDRWTEDTKRGGEYDVNSLSSSNSGSAYNSRITPTDESGASVGSPGSNTGYDPIIKGMKYNAQGPLTYQDNVNNWNAYNGSSGGGNSGASFTPGATDTISQTGASRRDSALDFYKSSNPGDNMIQQRNQNAVQSPVKTSSSATTPATTPPAEKTQYTASQIDLSFSAILTAPQAALYTALKTALIPATNPPISVENQTIIMNEINTLKIVPLSKLLTALQAALNNVINKYPDFKKYQTLDINNIGTVMNLIITSAMQGITQNIPNMTNEKLINTFSSLKMDIATLGSVQVKICQTVLAQASK